MKYVFVASSNRHKKEMWAVCEFLNGPAVDNVTAWPWPDAFGASKLTLAAIEDVLDQTAGAVLLATPESRYANDLMMPNPNILLELGLFMARLGAGNVAVCRFAGTELPTDLKNFNYIDVGEAAAEDPAAYRLPAAAEKQLRRWCDGLQDTPHRVSRTAVLHGYSGEWSVEMRHQKWRGEVVETPSWAQLTGSLILDIPNDEREVSGFFVGEFEAELRAPSLYTVKILVVEEVDRLEMRKDGSMDLISKLVARRIVDEKGPRPFEDDPNTEARGSKHYKWTLRIDDKSEIALKGTLVSQPRDHTIADIKMEKRHVSNPEHRPKPQARPAAAS